MEKHRWSNEEVAEYRQEHKSAFYFNPADTNMFVPKNLGFGFTFNFAHPGSWIPVLIVVGLFVKAALGSMGVI